jgi:hypothetical protein
VNSIELQLERLSPSFLVLFFGCKCFTINLKGSWFLCLRVKQAL